MALSTFRIYSNAARRTKHGKESSSTAPFRLYRQYDMHLPNAVSENCRCVARRAMVRESGGERLTLRSMRARCLAGPYGVLLSAKRTEYAASTERLPDSLPVYSVLRTTGNCGVRELRSSGCGVGHGRLEKYSHPIRSTEYGVLDPIALCLLYRSELRNFTT